MFVEEKEVGEVRELDDAAKLLLAVAEDIEKNGLSCGGAIDGQRRTCVAYKIGWLGFGGNHPDALDRLRRSLAKEGFPSVAKWSDAAGRDGRAELVVAKLRAVALGG